jgi:uncharacterized membrane protein
MFNEDHRVPTQTSICALFWRFLAMFALGVLVEVGVIAVLMVTLEDPLKTLFVIGTVLLTLGGMVAFILAVVYVEDLLRGYTKPPNKFVEVGVEMIKAGRKRFCPLVRFE